MTVLIKSLFSNRSTFFPKNEHNIHLLITNEIDVSAEPGINDVILTAFTLSYLMLQVEAEIFFQTYFSFLSGYPNKYLVAITKFHAQSHLFSLRYQSDKGTVARLLKDSLCLHKYRMTQKNGNF